jgi:PIN domain nuclease of toxin-antitoxin system
MTYLLDTHYLLWTLTDTSKLSKKITEVITNPDNDIGVSTISFWEVSLKASIGKLTIKGFSPEDLPAACTAMRFSIVPLGPAESSTYHHLKGTYHKDPFDRLLIWQAICNDLILISADSHIKKYTSEGLKILQT